MFICLLSSRDLIIFLIYSDDLEKTLQLSNLMCTDKSKNKESSHRTVWRLVDKIIQKRIFILNNFNILIHFCVVYLPLYHVSIVLYSSTQRYL